MVGFGVGLYACFIVGCCIRFIKILGLDTGGACVRVAAVLAMGPVEIEGFGIGMPDVITGCCLLGSEPDSMIAFKSGMKQQVLMHTLPAVGFLISL